MKENLFGRIAKFGVLAVLFLSLLDVYCVWRYYRLHRTTTAVEQTAQELMNRRQAIESTLRELGARAATDANLMQVFRYYESARTNAPAATPFRSSLP